MSEQSASEGIIYKTIPGYPGYLVGSDGTLWQIRHSRLGKYGGATLRNGSARRSAYLHRLILEAFVGPCPKGMECRHLDGNPKNNALSNLAWGTHSENQGDRARHGTLKLGSKLKHAKLNETDIPRIRKLHAEGESSAAIGRIFKVNSQTIGAILTGRTWKHVS